MAENVTLEFLARLITEQREETRENFAALERRIERLEQQRMDGIGARLQWFADRTTTDFQRLNERLDGIAARMDDLRLRVDALETQ